MPRVEIPGKATKFADAVLVASAMLCTLISLYAVYLQRVAYYYALPAVAAGLLFASLKLPPSLKVRLSVMVLAGIIGFYAVELTAWLMVGFSRGTNLRRAAAKSAVTADFRTKLEVIRYLRWNGVDAYPSPVSPWAGKVEGNGVLRSAIRVGGAETLPLGGVANKATVLCNESGQYVTYESDERGFHNPKGIWSAPRVDVVGVGDSFVHGQCVRSDENLMAWIRKRYPATINLGMSGVGPLQMLAAIQEYVVDLRPAIIVWGHYEGNDLIDLRIEKGSPLLMRYLDENFRQGLRHKQAEIDPAVGAVVERKIASAKAEHRFDIMDFMTLHGVRARLYPALGVWPGSPDEAEYDLFRKVLRKANASAVSWGGRIYFVYLPAGERYYSRPLFRRSHPYEEMRRRVLSLVEELKIPIVDVHRAFVAQGDPRAMFFYPGSHYSAEGYRVAAQAVLDTFQNTR